MSPLRSSAAATVEFPCGYECLSGGLLTFGNVTARKVARGRRPLHKSMNQRTRCRRCSPRSWLKCVTDVELYNFDFVKTASASSPISASVTASGVNILLRQRMPLKRSTWLADIPNTSAASSTPLKRFVRLAVATACSLAFERRQFFAILQNNPLISLRWYTQQRRWRGWGIGLPDTTAHAVSKCQCACPLEGTQW